MAIPVQSSSAGADRVQLELLRRAGLARRFDLARSLSESAIALARRAIQARHPDLPEREILLRFVETHYGLALGRSVRSHLSRAPR